MENCKNLQRQQALLDEMSSFGYTEAVAQRCSIQKVFLRISQTSEENISVRFSIFNKVAKKRDYNAHVFL